MAGKLKLRFVADELIEKYRNGMSQKDLMREYSCSFEAVSNLLKACNVPIKDCSSELRHRIGDTYTYFENIDSEDKAYFLGFLITDGCVYSPKVRSQKQVKLSLNARDEYILELFKQETGATQKITGNNDMRAISICSNKMVEDLSKYGVVERKTDKVFLPTLNESLMPHLLRGIWDGDGCFYQHPKTGRKLFQLCSASLLLIEQINDHLVNSKIIIGGSTTSYGTYYSYNLWKAGDVKSFGKYIYEGAVTYLERKKEKFDNSSSNFIV